MSAPATFSFSGETGEMPALGFGTSPMTGGMSAETVLAALKAGYRHIDTARKYGTESAVGEAMRASDLPRQDIFLTTKVSHESSPRPTLPNQSTKASPRSGSTTSTCCWCTGPIRR